MAAKKGIGQYFEMSYLTSDLILKNVLFALFLGFLGMIYIANGHYAERNVRQIQELRRELKEIKWHCNTLQAENRYKSRRSAIAQEVKELGLEPSKDKPKKIILKD